MTPVSTNANRLEQILGDLRKLPLLPTTAQQAMSVANDQSANLKDFSALLERDVTLASSILKLANSPYFNWGRGIESVDQAVIRLGLRECQQLIIAVSMKNLFQETDPVTKASCAVLWQHCFLTACFCRRLNRDLHFDYQGEEFTAGLLHDLGRILLAVTRPKQFAQADPMNFLEAPGILERERHLAGVDHCQVGTEYAQHNRLPFSAIAAIRFHHKLEEARDHKGILGLVALADDMANHLQRREKPQTYPLDQNPAFDFLARGWPENRVETFKRSVPALMAETEQTASQQSRPRKTGSSTRIPVARNADAAASQGKSALGSLRSWFGL